MTSVFQDHCTARRQSPEELAALVNELNDKTRHWSEHEALINERASRRFQFSVVVDRVSRTYSTTESSLRDGYTLEGRIAQVDVKVRIELPKQLNDQVSNLDRNSTFAVEGVLNRWVSLLKRLEFWGWDPTDAAAEVADAPPSPAVSPLASAGAAESQGGNLSILEQARRQGAFPRDDDGGRPQRSTMGKQRRTRSQPGPADPMMNAPIIFVCLMFIAPLYLALVFIALGCVAGVLLSLFALVSGEADNAASMIGMLLALVLFGGLGYPSCLGAYHATRGLPKVIPWLRKSLSSQGR